MGHEISSTRYFHPFQSLRSLESITENIVTLERDTERLLHRTVADLEASR